jgi:hypothetical protein
LKLKCDIRKAGFANPAGFRIQTALLAKCFTISKFNESKNKHIFSYL